MTAQKTDSLVHRDLDPDTLLSVLAIIEPVLGRDIPQWGSPAWLAMPDGHPDREAAEILAAHAWWSALVFGAGVPRDVLRQQVLATLKVASLDVRGAADWPKLVAEHAVQQRVLRVRANGYRGAA